MMTDKPMDVPVLVVGGGPVGLSLAIDLGWRGIECQVLEQGDGSVDHPRLGIILTRTMELCRRWGIVDKIYDCGFNNDYKLNVVYATSMTGYLLGRDENPSCNDMPAPIQSTEKRQRCPQIWFNPILEKAALQFPSVNVMHHHKLDGFQDCKDHVEIFATDSQSGKKRHYRAQYLVACDGAASSVRASLGIEMQGNPALSYSVNIFIRSPDLLSLHDKGEAERYIFVGTQGTWANLTVVDGRELWRITIIGSEQMMDMDELDATALVRECLGTDHIPFELLSVKPWRRTELIASKFSSGRVFLAGDAAHTMSPTGGHGMNTGVSDVADLGWKFQALLQGWGGQGLLDAYEKERKPVAQAVAAASAKNFRAWVSATSCEDILDSTPSGEATRQRIGHHMTEVGREDWDSLGLQLGVRYDESPICVHDGSPAPALTVIDYQQTSRPGARAPHAWLAEGYSTLDLFGKSYVLMQFDMGAFVGNLEHLARQRGVPLKREVIHDLSIAKLYERRLVLVRPDGVVAWRGDALPADCTELLDTVTGH